MKESSPNVNFGKFIVSELDQLPVKYQRKAKHQIVIILYGFHDKAEDENTQSVFSPNSTISTSIQPTGPKQNLTGASL